MVPRISILGALLGVFILPVQGPAATGVLVPSSEASQKIVIKEATLKDGSVVSGTVVNNSTKTVRDVGFRVRQEWLWNDELHPGPDSPGRTVPFTLHQEIAPHATAAFTIQIPPLAPRSDGRFVTTLEVTGFTEVGF
jgi:hypothetical protein